MTELSKEMQETLLLIGYGVNSTVDGFVSDDDPDRRVDLRSVSALARRGLVATAGTGVGSGLIISTLGLTELGRSEFHSLREEEWKRRRW